MKRNATFYWKKIHLKKNGKDNLRFQLYKHSMGKLTEYHFCECTNKEQTDIRKQMMEDYKIDLPDGWYRDEDDLQISFMINASENTSSHEQQTVHDYELLDKSYVMIWRKVIQMPHKPTEYGTDMLIYCLKDCTHPIVKIKDTNIFDCTQVGFFKKEFIKDKEHEVAFSILGWDGYEMLCDERKTLENFKEVFNPEAPKEYQKPRCQSLSTGWT